MTSPFSNYLRTYRKRSGLTQKELACLLGCKTSQIVSRYEHNICEPSLRTIFAFQIIFGIPADELFHSAYAETEILVQDRVHELSQNISKRTPSPRGLHKLKTLENINNYQPNQTHI